VINATVGPKSFIRNIHRGFGVSYLSGPPRTDLLEGLKTPSPAGFLAADPTQSRRFHEPKQAALHALIVTLKSAPTLCHLIVESSMIAITFAI
jgi:hypothetical protein